MVRILRLYICGTLNSVEILICGSLEMGSPIGRKPLVKLFSSVIRKDDDDYFLVTPVEKIGITVDDAPFTAVEMFCDREGKDQVISFRTQVDDYVIVDREHPFRIEIDPGVFQQTGPRRLGRVRLQ